LRSPVSVSMIGVFYNLQRGVSHAIWMAYWPFEP